MDYIYDAPFSNVFRCDGDIDFHDYYYISPILVDEQSFLYRVHRTGLERSLPNLLEIERDSTTRFCEIFCILSGTGYLEYDSQKYELHQNQLVLLPSHKAHRYWCDSNNPMGKVWLEIYGGDADRIIRHLVELNGPVTEGALFPDVCAQLCLIQQRLMIDKYYQPSREIYNVLFTMLSHNETLSSLQLREDSRANFMLAEAYISAHISRRISNAELADVCGLSLQHFLKLFKDYYMITPQEFIMNQRLKKAQYALLHTDLSVETIADSYGFCNTSHFIKRFAKSYGMSPAKYRKSIYGGK